jgi:hypothetical protein
MSSNASESYLTVQLQDSAKRGQNRPLFCLSPVLRDPGTAVLRIPLPWWFPDEPQVVRSAPCSGEKIASLARKISLLARLAKFRRK